MAYFMVHLTIAAELAARCAIRDEEAFYKGSLAPDAIMFREGAQRADKAATHFCPDGWVWGRSADDDAWKAKLLRDIRAAKGANGGSFLLGYLTHLLADTQNNRRFWTPTRLQDSPAHAQAYFEDISEIDSRLLAELPGRGRVLALLRTPICEEIGGLYTADDYGRLASAMLDTMYKDRLPNPAHVFRAVSPEAMRAYISDVVREAVGFADEFLREE